jgi:uncharacterized protein
MQQRLNKLKNILREMESVLVAYSGGVDSTFLLKVARDVLRERAAGVIASSATYPSEEIDSALLLAQSLGIPVMEIHTDELSHKEFTRNAPDRCYHCKLELFGKLKEIAADQGFKHLAHGNNVDDLGDYRPGMKAAEELGARAPLQEAGLTKEMIRALSKEMGLSTWDKPSLACLASRFPYGTSITPEALGQVEEAEKCIRALGFRQLRVRHHGAIARIEIEKEEMPRLLQPEVREKVLEGIKAAGFLYAALDLEGYRTGSMNAVLEKKE